MTATRSQYSVAELERIAADAAYLDTIFKALGPDERVAILRLAEGLAQLCAVPAGPAIRERVDAMISRLVESVRTASAALGGR